MLPPVPTKSDAAEKAAEVEATISTRRIGLLDAVRVTLLKNPTIKLNAESVAQARASLRQATGQFDTTLSGNLNWAYQESELPWDQAKSSQLNPFHQNQVKRSGLESGIVQSEDEIAQLNRGIQPLPDTSSIADPKQRATAILQNQVDQQIQDLTNQVINEVATPAQFAQIAKIRSESTQLGAQVQTDLLNGLKTQLKQLNTQIQDNPPITVRKTETTSYEVDLLKEFRNGISFGPFIDYNRSNDNFTRRSGVGDLSTSNVGLQIIVPMGKGSGAAASAQERSSAVNLEASRLTLHHTVSQSVLQTIQGYWNLVAAQERLRLLFRSELISGAIVDLSQRTLIQGGRNGTGGTRADPGATGDPHLAACVRGAGLGGRRTNPRRIHGPGLEGTPHCSPGGRTLPATAAHGDAQKEPRARRWPPWRWKIGRIGWRP